jgi:hypothetical protein
MKSTDGDQDNLGRVRPYKHVAEKIDSGGRAHYQNVLGISVARFAAPWGEIPVAATAE